MQDWQPLALGQVVNVTDVVTLCKKSLPNPNIGHSIFTLHILRSACNYTNFCCYAKRLAQKNLKTFFSVQIILFSKANFARIKPLLRILMVT